MAVRPGILKLKAETQAEKLRQHLYLNPEILSNDFLPFGVERPSNFRNWSIKGIHSVADVRNSDNTSWLDSTALYRITKSPNVIAIRNRVIEALQDWDLAAPELLQAGMWLQAEDPLLKGVHYHLLDSDGESWLTEVYHKSPQTEQLFKEIGEPVSLPYGRVTEARILIRSKAGSVIEFNPKDPVDDSVSVWVYGSGEIKALSFDPKEWKWRRQGLIKQGHFFEYATKRGYRIILKNKYRQLGFDKWLEDRGYSDQQRKSFFLKLWHP